MAELFQLPGVLQKHIFEFAGGEEQHISQTCKQGHAYGAPLLSACSRAIDEVLAADVVPVNKQRLDEALDNLEDHANFFAARNCLCNFGRVVFADCYWFCEVYMKRDEMNELH